ncbi:HEAT repeat-containing protein 6 [Homalodisca vitripennis]|nr:HEAT repeat-containing protein 6 [Homalodisca vitripennis]
MALLLCCARDDEPVVRTAALQAMASLLIYSQVTVLYMLTNCCKIRLSCMALLLCCARDDEPVVRTAGLQAMASLLIYSQVTVLYMLTNCCTIHLNCMALLLCCARDDEPVVRTAALQAMASLLIYSQDEQFVCDCCDVICQLVKDPVPLVSAKAAWALGNLTDMLLKTQQGEEIISPIQLIRTSIEVAQGKVKMRANGVRALGNLLGLLRERHLCTPEYKDVPLQASEVLVKNASASNIMKVSWNACYALGSLLKNEAIHEASCSWQDVVLPTLCSLVVRSSNFKVRTNACAALACVPLRRYYGVHYLAVWKAVLDGLDNALNMSDFREVKHQDGLLEQLCLTLCHLTSLVELADLSALYEVAVYHVDTLQQHISRFLNSTVPERADAVLRAAASLALLREQQLTVTQRNSVTILSDVFTFDI